MSDQQKRIGAIALTVVALGLLAGMVWRSFGTETVAANVRILMDSETGELVEIPTADLKPWPMVNPRTGKQTLHRTEVCYWGEECRKAGGTRVILNSSLGKKEPTHCPVCGHVVRPHNPRPPDYQPDED